MLMGVFCCCLVDDFVTPSSTPPNEKAAEDPVTESLAKDPSAESLDSVTDSHQQQPGLSFSNVFSQDLSDMALRDKIYDK